MISPDGSTITYSSVALQTAAGVWTLGAPSAQYPGTRAILLNNKATPGSGSLASELIVANGGQLYALGRAATWFVWKAGGWVATTNPTAPQPTAITFAPTAPNQLNSVPSGTVVATATVAMSDGSAYTGALQISGDNLFSLSGKNVVTARAMTSADDKTHTVTVTAGPISAALTIIISGAAAPPVPTSVTLTPASVSLPDNSPVGTAVSTVAVATSDGSPFAGTLTIGVNNMVALSGSTVALTRALTAADDGAHSFLITATENAGTASATLVLNATAVAPASPQITVNPAAPQIPDTTPKGSVVATYAVTMSDGSSFAGTVAFGAPNMDSGGIFALVSTGPASGQIIVNPNGPGVGPNMTTITDHVTLVATT